MADQPGKGEIQPTDKFYQKNYRHYDYDDMGNDMEPEVFMLKHLDSGFIEQSM